MYFIKRDILITISFVFFIITFLFPVKFIFLCDIFIFFLWYIRWTIFYTIKRINIKRIVDDTYLFIGEPTSIRISIKNNSLFPAFFLEVEDEARDEGALFVNGRNSFYFFLKPNEEKEEKYNVEFRKRGIYILKKIRVILHDPFGISKIERIFDIPVKIVVYPERVPIVSLPLSVRELLPAFLTNYKLLEDFNYIDGVREYGFLDPIKRIQWKASAHTGKLLVKKYEYTATTKIHIFVDLNLSDEIFAKKVWANIRKRYEEYVISASASIVEYILSNRIPIELYIIDKNEHVDIVKNPNFANLMEHLVGVKGSDSPSYFLRNAIEENLYKFTYSSTVIIFSMYLTSSILPLLIKVKTKVSRVIVLIMPFGFRSCEYKRYLRPYDVFPQDIRELEKRAMVLRDEGIIVELVDPQDSLNEVLNGSVG